MSERLCLGVLRVDGIEFAVADADLQEVVHAPERYAQLPDAASFVLGAMPFHGRAVPVIDLAGVLHPGQSREPQSRRLVAVLRCDAGQLGVPIDDIVRVSRPMPEAISPLDTAAPGEAAVLCEAILESDSVVPRLDVGRLAKLPGARVAPAVAETAPAAADSPGSQVELALFTVAGLTFGVPLECASRARTVPPPCLDSLGCPALHGFCDLDGHPSAVVNLAGALGIASSAPAADADRAMVLEADGEVMHLGISGVLGLEICMQTRLRPLDAGEIPESKALLGAYTSPRHGRVLVLDPRGLFGLPALRSLCRRAPVASLANGVASGSQDAGTPREESASSYLVYGVGRSTFATPLEEVRAVLNFPEERTRLREEGEASLGVMTWQGRVVPLTDLGTLMGMPTVAAELTHAKVLVAGEPGAERGFVVARVESLQTEAPRPAPWAAATESGLRGRLGSRVPRVDHMIPVRGDSRRRNAGVLNLQHVGI